MKQDTDPSAGFENRLLGELRGMVHERGEEAAAAERADADVAGRRLGPRVALGGAAALAATAAAVIATAGGDGTTAAYAVEPRGDGEISVEISQLRDASGLEEALREAGVPAEVDYLPAGMTCREPRLRPARAAAGGKVTSGLRVKGDGAAVFSISRDAVRPGQTLVLTASGAPGASAAAAASSLQTQIAAGPVRPCVQVPAPAGAPVPPGDGAGGTESGTSRSGSSSPGAPEKGLSSGGEGG